MTKIANLLAMPEDWEKRPEAWQRLTCSPLLFDALREIMCSQVLDQMSPWVKQWQAFMDSRGEQARREWKTFCILFLCARIAALNGETAPQLSSLLYELDPQTQLPDELACRTASQDAYTWRQFLRDSIYRLTWQSPLSAEWAWDTLTTLMGNPRPVAHSASIGALLVVNGGVTARLTLDELADEGQGELYPDPHTLSFVNCGEQFQQAAQSAVVYTRNEGLWKKDKRMDVRWKLARQDGKQLTHIDGGSAGDVCVRAGAC